VTAFSRLTTAPADRTRRRSPRSTGSLDVTAPVSSPSARSWR